MKLSFGSTAPWCRDECQCTDVNAEAEVSKSGSVEKAGMSKNDAEEPRRARAAK